MLCCLIILAILGYKKYDQYNTVKMLSTRDRAVNNSIISNIKHVYEQDEREMSTNVASNELLTAGTELHATTLAAAIDQVTRRGDSMKL
ncbi:hypothetical protein BIY23_02935 [Wolbachia pipientis]|uniref:Uncharacterized protein n=1 Tax=Wolbachia pipientis TaxID=955 RepID=A0A1E7QJI7_WOLPI|nr:hypothetical protein [Wolbachia pipientis]OEY86633.1 hypothetical protein BIY23_02935 [Wolbachia pipientis]